MIARTVATVNYTNWLGITLDELAALYQEHTTREIAAMFGINDETVRKRMVRWGIPRRNRGGRRSFNPSAEELAALYQTMSMRQISLKYDVGETVVWKRLKEFGIKLKDFEDGGHRKKPGRIFSRAHVHNMSRVRRGKWSGERNPNWKGGVLEDHLRIRRTGEYKQWRVDALIRVGYACELCGAEQGGVCPCCGVKLTLHVHHIDRFADFPERRFDPTNSRVLCPKCHRTEHHGKSGELLESP